MADTAIAITAGTGTNVDTRTESTNGNHRQVVVLGDPATNAGVAPVDSTNGLAVDVKAIAAGTNLIGKVSIDQVTANANEIVTKTGSVTKLEANSGVDIGDVDVASIAAGTNLIGKTGIDQVTANANEVVAKTGSLVALEAGTAEIGKLAAGVAEIGNVKNAGTFAVQSTLQTGANAIGKLAANSGVDIGDVDILSIAAGDNNIGNVDIVTIPDAAQDTNYFQATITSADATTATAVKAKTAAKKIHVTSLIISVDTDMTVQLQSDNGSPQIVMEQAYLSATSGLVITFPERFPLTVNTNEDLDVITSAAGNISVTVTGYVV